MKRLFIYFLILLAAVWLGLKIQADPGYVLIAYRNLNIETTLWFAVFSLILFFLLSYLFIRFVHLSKILPKRILIWWYKRSEKKAVRLTTIGLFKLAEKNWAQAENFLIQAARTLPNPLVNYVQAAYAANKQAAYRRRDNYLSKACASQHKAEFFIGMIQAKMQLVSKQFEQALATLTRLQEIKPNQRTVLELLKDTYLALSDWNALKDLLKTLERRSVLSKNDFYALKVQVYLELLKQNIANTKPAAIEKFWQKIPKDLHGDATLVHYYAKYLLNHNSAIQAEQLVANALHKNWAPTLLEIYPQTRHEKPVKQLALMEKWLKSHPNDPDLLLCLGRMCKKQELWGKARSYLEHSVKLAPRAETYLELGTVMEKYGDALKYYRNGLLTLTTNALKK